MSADIVVLEWICGGGVDFSAVVDGLPPPELPSPGTPELSSLRSEGAAMLTTLAGGFAGAKHRVHAAVSQGCREFLGKQLPSSVHIRLMPQQPERELLDAWRELASESTWTIVIAPECDGILQCAMAALSGAKSQLMNCDQALIGVAADKVLMSTKFIAHRIPHPATRRVEDVDAAWLEQSAADANLRGSGLRWIIKPTRGAGCEGIVIADSNEVLERQSAARRFTTHATSEKAAPPVADGYLVQPLLEPFARGDNYSANVWIDRQGHWHFLPLTKQKIMIEPTDRGEQQALHYAGGAVLASQPLSDDLRALLRRAVAACGGTARGWIGLDLLYGNTSPHWTVIEVNPRFTTALVGFAKSYTGDFFGDIMKLYQGQLDHWAAEFADVEFDVLGA